jgi:hypothetical protein
MALSEPELMALAKSRYGLDAASYTPEQAFRHLAFKRAFGYALIAAGILPTIKFGKRKITVRAVDIVRLMEEPPLAALEAMNADKAGRERQRSTA